jgi:hypothetical protein
MIELTDAQADRICARLLREARAVHVDHSNPGIFKPVFDLAAGIVEAATGGRLAAADWLARYSFALGMVVFVPARVKGAHRVLTFAHECGGHVEQFWLHGWSGHEPDKFYQPMAVSYVADLPSRAWLEGDAGGAEVEAMIALGATRDEVRDRIAWLRDVALPDYGLDAAECADAAAVMESHAVSLFAGAAPSRASTRAIREELAALGILS